MSEADGEPVGRQRRRGGRSGRAHGGGWVHGRSGRGGIRGRVVVPSLAAGVLVAASVPPHGLWELGLVGLGLLAWRLMGLRGRARLLAGGWFGVGLFGPTLAWIPAFSGIGYVIVVVLESLFFALACGLVPAGRGRALAFPAAVTLAEAARSAWPFGGLPMGGIPLGQASGPLLATARVGGPLLVTGLAALGGVCLAQTAALVQLWWRAHFGEEYARSRPAAVPTHDPRPPRTGPAALLAAVVVVGAVAASGNLAPDGGPPVGSITVALVQGGGIRGLRAVNVNPEIGFYDQLRESQHVTPPVDLVVWPEDTVALPGPLAGTVAEAQLAELAKSFHATLVAGVTDDVGATQFLNRAVAWAPSGKVIGSYEKVHRVPFGEYVPGRSILRHLVSLAYVPRDAIAGHGPGMLRTPAGPLGVMISYEVFFAGRARAAVRAGGQVLVVPTNTSSYVGDQVPSEEVAADRLRAVEEGRDLVQASPTGYSTVVTHDGRLRESSALGVPAVVQATVAKRRGLTLYERGGELPELALAAAALLAGWAQGVARRSGGVARQAPGLAARRAP